MRKLTPSSWVKVQRPDVSPDRIDNAIAWLRKHREAIESHFPMQVDTYFFYPDSIEIWERSLFPSWTTWKQQRSISVGVIYIFLPIGALRKQLGAIPEHKVVACKTERNTTQLKPLEVLNVKLDPDLFDRTDVAYIGRQYRMKSGRVIKASPLANEFVIGRDGDRPEVCAKCRERQIKPAMEHRVGTVFGELKRLTERYLNGELTSVACWCTQPDKHVECHGHDVAAAIHTLAAEASEAVVYKTEKNATGILATGRLPDVKWAITLHRPWPYAIACLGKRLENRNWEPSGVRVGDWFAVHAGAKWDKEGAQWIQDSGLGEVPLEGEHPRGVILLAKYGGVVEGLMATADPWFVGPLAWKIDDVIVLPEAIACQGKQKLWSLPVHVRKEISSMEVSMYAAA